MKLNYQGELRDFLQHLRTHKDFFYDTKVQKNDALKRTKAIWTRNHFNIVPVGPFQLLRTDLIVIVQEEILEAYQDICFNKIRPTLSKLFSKIPESKLTCVLSLHSISKLYLDYKYLKT